MRPPARRVSKSATQKVSPWATRSPSAPPRTGKRLPSPQSALGIRVPPLDFTPALDQAHTNAEEVVAPGTGLDLAAPLKFNHAANLPFSDRGTGISFQPATAFAHSSNEPVQALGTGITLDRPLANGHEINAVVRDAAVTDRRLPGDARTQSVVRGTRTHYQMPSPSADHLGRSGQYGAAGRLGRGCRQPQLWRPRRPMGRRRLPGYLRLRADWLPRACARPGP